MEAPGLFDQNIRRDADGDPLCGFPHRVAREMRVARGGFDPAMTEKPADDRQALAEGERPRGKAVPDVMDANVVEPGPRADGLPSPVDIGHVRARLGSRNDPGIAGLARQGLEDADRRRRHVDRAGASLPVGEVNLGRVYWIKTGQLDRDLLAGAREYAPRPPVAHKLDPYKGIIDARLEAYPKLSATRLFDEVRAAGYPGGYARVRDYVRTVRPREPVEAPVRFETPAGHQDQVDFGTFTLPWGRRHALVIVLGYSRLLWLHFYPRQTMAVLMEALESAFEQFGGVPEELLFDQMRAVVLSDDRAAGGGLVLNAEFLRFAAHWGFMPRSCRPYRAQTKGKVDRPIRYIRESFFYGRTFANDDDLNEQAARWLEGTANVRRHATTGERPVDRFERDERSALLPLANCPYRRLGLSQAPEPRPRRLPATVEVERRPLSVYAEALQ